MMRLRRPTMTVEALALAGAALLVAGFNGPFWSALLADRTFAHWPDWRLAIGTFVMLVAAFFFLIALVATRHTVRGLLGALIAIASVAWYFERRYGVVLDPPMLRSVLATDPREAGELIGPGFFAALALGIGAAATPWLVRLKTRPTRRAIAVRAGALAAALAVAAAALLAVFQDFGSLMRNRRELRYLITPANVVWSTARVLASDAKRGVAQRDPPEPAVRAVAAQRKPTLLVFVVGETARAANFSLNGYPRPTNPELAQLDVVNFGHARACGTSTEVSLPCMFSPFGRADYDEDRIRRHESLLHLLARAGLRVVWLDNQSGCKGVCDGLEVRDLSHARRDGVCDAERCLDEILLDGLREVVERGTGDTVVVMHQLGNHGPAYFRRYPPAFRRFEPACERKELADCTREQIVNAYDNAILYTDHLLARTIRYLDALRERYDVALLYASDHGESLGERGLYLHGMPYPVAPREQLEVPMLWWFAPDSARGLDVDLACLRHRAAQPASHDELFHSVLGLLAVSTPRYLPQRDVFGACRSSRLAGATTGG
ncbi:MAG: phosphoethanolamine--lipid A transferase [Burkholderiaceae bacterium]